MQDLETKRSKYKGQLMDVKTNKEYTAMLHEIEGVEREIRAREDLMLAEMEKAEGLTAEVKREEGDFKVVETERRRPGRETRRRGAARSRPRRTGWRRARRRRRRRYRSPRASCTRASPGARHRVSRRRATACARPATCGCGSRSGSRSASTTRCSSASRAAASLLRAAAAHGRRRSLEAPGSRCASTWTARAGATPAKPASAST